MVETASRVYAYVRRYEGIEEADLRKYGERNKIKADDMNRAIGFLRETQQLVAIPDGTPFPE